MIFPTASDMVRPIRLPESIRQWAWESLHGKYGDEAMRYNSVSMDDFPEFDALDDLKKYDAAITQIAACAPIRICPHERVSGSATLGAAPTRETVHIRPTAIP